MNSSATHPKPVREQIEALPLDSVFWARDVIGNPSTVSAAISRLTADPDSGVHRLAPGLYWRGRPGAWPPSETDVSLFYAGAGAGFAGWSAVFSLQWGHQVPRHNTVAVVRRQIKPPNAITRYVIRRNRRREELTWTEVSVLEALAEEEMIEYDWEDRVETLANGWSGCGIGGLTREGVFRPAAVVWAAETDQIASVDLIVRAEELMRSMPDVVYPVSMTELVENAVA